jgi:BASS family bile acid:Na+ symporter
MDLTSLILLVLKISILLNVLALGLEATLADATFLFRRPRRLVRALLSMNVLMPLVALLLAVTFALKPAVKIALVALSVSPVPPLFPKKALKAGAKENYTFGLLFAMAVLAIVVIPITMEIFERVVGTPLQMSVGLVAKLVFTTVLAPLLAGIGLRAWAPLFAEKAAAPVAKFASALLILSVLAVFIGSVRSILSLIGDGTLFSLAGFALAGLVIGHWLGGPELEDRRVLSLATATRHPGMAVAIAQANFPGQKLAVPAIALYLVVAGVLSALASARYARREAAPKETGKRAA